MLYTKTHKSKTQFKKDQVGGCDGYGGGNETVEQVNSYKYLGSVKCSDGDCNKDILARIAMAKKRTTELKSI